MTRLFFQKVSNRFYRETGSLARLPRNGAWRNLDDRSSSRRPSRCRQVHVRYVTARAMYNLANAAEAGRRGTVAEARDFALVSGRGEPAGVARTGSQLK